MDDDTRDCEIADLRARLDAVQAQPQAIPAKRKRKGRRILGIIVLVGIVYAFYIVGSTDVSKTAAVTSTEATVPPQPMPLAERQFLNAVSEGRNQYESGANDMAKGAARPARGQAVCAVLHDPVDWVGTVEQLSSNGDGLGVLDIRLDPNVTVSTWNNALSDISDHTLIAANSAVMRSASALSHGQTVIFSGSFIRSATDCAKERSLTIRGSMEDPDYIVRFAAIRAAP